MAFRFVAILAAFSVASAGIVPVSQVYHPAPTAVTSAYLQEPTVSHYVPAPTVLSPVSAAPVAYAQAPIAVAHHTHQPLLTHHEEAYDPHPQYKYGYDVQDELTGDSKSHSEERDGDVVRGEYSLIDSDGFRRTVTYTADAVHGFNAVVNRVPLEQHIKTVVKTNVAAVPVVAPVAYAHAPASAIVKVDPAYHEYHH